MFTYVYCGVRPHERERRTKRTNHESCAVGGPHSRVLVAAD